MTLTKQAFDKFRERFSPAKPPREGLIQNDDEKILLDPTQGLEQWEDGSVTGVAEVPARPEIGEELLCYKRLWVVRSDDVVHAHEFCEKGRDFETGVIKHTNLTGGEPAFCGGELLFTNSDTIVVNGCSGRYGPSTEDEMQCVATSFKNSGYKVWSCGFDDETNRPYPFRVIDPLWVR